MRLAVPSSLQHLSSSTASVALLCLVSALLAVRPAHASKGDQLPEFKACVQDCISRNCLYPQTPIPIHLQLLFWDCRSECDYACQRSLTASRISQNLPVEQFHGKWPFRRLFGIQEPFSVLFSALNLYAHYAGLRTLRRDLPQNYPLAPYYAAFSYIGMVCWLCSALFHTRDFTLTERMDYFGAGANVMYGLYYCPIRIFRLYKPHRRRALQLWGLLCLAAYLAHVYYLQFVRWDYTYNMAANVAVGAVANILWTCYSVCAYIRVKRFWAAWPGLIVTWLIMAMSLELLDFPPFADALDAHALWHAATILPTVYWYRFLVLDARGSMDYVDAPPLAEAKARTL